ncbi:MAG TPA: hypothetical protein PLN81_12565, partial [Bacillota bacterium]|nr:hypothetical protein [Bacillota bacterium]
AEGEEVCLITTATSGFKESGSTFCVQGKNGAFSGKIWEQLPTHRVDFGSKETTFATSMLTSVKG